MDLMIITVIPPIAAYAMTMPLIAGYNVAAKADDRASHWLSYPAL